MAKLYKLITAVVKGGWRSVCRPHFVFDGGTYQVLPFTWQTPCTWIGPFPPLKFGTIISRMKDNVVRRAELFFRTSQRTVPPPIPQRNRILPPLVFVTSVQALNNSLKTVCRSSCTSPRGGRPVLGPSLRKVNGYVTGRIRTLSSSTRRV